MPFSEKQIEDAFMRSAFAVNGNFAEEIRQVGCTQTGQVLLDKLRRDIGWENYKTVLDYITLVGVENAFVERHYFEQGWLMCREQKNK
jgi:hypothetical protein